MIHGKHRKRSIDSGPSNSKRFLLPTPDAWDQVSTVLSSRFTNIASLEKGLSVIYSRINNVTSPALDETFHFPVIRDFVRGCEEDEMNHFFDETLPVMQTLAKLLPNVVPQDLRFLPEQIPQTMTLTREFVASVMACAMLLAIPTDRPDRGRYPTFDFIDFYAIRIPSQVEKFKMLLCYFDTIGMKILQLHELKSLDSLANRSSSGSIRIQRVVFDAKSISNLATSTVPLRSFRFVSDKIEDVDGAIHADFANRYIGGGVLSAGRVQEEISFSIHPECMVSMMLCPAMEDNEAILISGARRYSEYTGYGNSLKFAGPSALGMDTDDSHHVPISAFDALNSAGLAWQYSESSIVREITKACAAMQRVDGIEGEGKDLMPFATGFWGCGAFGNDPRLKIIQQWISAAICSRDVIFSSYKADPKLVLELDGMMTRLLQKGVNVGHIACVLLGMASNDGFKHDINDLLNRLESRVLEVIASCDVEDEDNSLFGG